MVVINTVTRLVSSCTLIAFRAEAVFAGGIKNQMHLCCPNLIMW